ncbi:hypothetical protein [Paenibacillus sp. SI8]|uniref:hypothetical protein n=1 Tax=unclassified Paenibacillus TaxID=185978 RepID=UPI0034657F46
MTDKIVFSIVIDSSQATVGNVTQWFKSFNYFQASEMKGTFLTKGSLRKYNEKSFYNGIEKELKANKPITLGIEYEDNWLTFKKSSYHSFLTCNLTSDIFAKNKEDILKYIDLFFEKYEGIVAYACSSEDNFWQNNTDIDFFGIKNKSMNNVRLKPCPVLVGRQIVDVEYNPGHSHFIKDVWFGSCWAMWFGEKFFEFIPNEILSGFNDLYEKKQLENGSLRMMLYENLWESELPRHREIQWKFRRQVGMDEVAHKLMNEPDYNEIDPSIEISTTGEFKHGGVRLITYYFDREGNVVPRSKAMESKSYEFNDKGKVVWSSTVGL